MVGALAFAVLGPVVVEPGDVAVVEPEDVLERLEVADDVSVVPEGLFPPDTDERVDDRGPLGFDGARPAG